MASHNSESAGLTAIKPRPLCGIMTCGDDLLRMRDGTEYTVVVDDERTQVSRASWRRPEGEPIVAILFGTDPRVSCGGETSPALEKGTTTFVAGPYVPDIVFNHTSPQPTIFDSSVNTAIPDSEVPDNDMPDS